MFSKLILKNVNTKKDIPLNKIKKKQSYNNNIHTKYCGDCNFMDFKNNICDLHNIKINAYDEICQSYESSFI